MKTFQQFCEDAAQTNLKLRQQDAAAKTKEKLAQMKQNSEELRQQRIQQLKAQRIQQEEERIKQETQRRLDSLENQRQQ